MTSHTFVVPTRPMAKGRPRVTKSGQVYTPQNTQKFEKAVKEAYDGPLFPESPLAVSMLLYGDRAEVTIEDIDSDKAVLTGDTDNYVKAVLDALNGVAYVDDKWVYVLHAQKFPKGAL